MSKTRFNKKRSALKPEWILEGMQSGSATPTATSSDGFQSRPPSSLDQQHITAPVLCTEAVKQAEESEVIHENHALLPDSQVKGAKAKSRYSKAHQSTWTMSPIADNTNENSTSARKSESKAKSSTRRVMRSLVSNNKATNIPSPTSMVPPAPTRNDFSMKSLPPEMRTHKRSDSPCTQSPNNGADVPARAPYIASNYTPTCSPEY